MSAAALPTAPPPDMPALDILMIGGAIGGAVGAGLVAGIFLAFSGFVMRALADLPPSAGILAMQRINLRVLTVPIMALLFGTGIASLGLGVAGGLALADGAVARGLALLLGAGAYLPGCLAITGLRNVPLNERLAPLDPAGAGAGAEAEAARLWRVYLDRWTVWNHRRTAAATLASLCFALAPIL